MKIVGMCLLLACLCGASATGEIIPGQAVSWSNFSYINSITTSGDFAYFATTEGILRYHRFEQKWYDPITASDGLRGDNVYRIAVPDDDAWITVETEQGIYTYESGLERWMLDTDFPEEYSADSRVKTPLQHYFMPFEYTLDPRGVISDREFRNWQITAMLDDQYSTIFFGTWGLGPLKSDNIDLRMEFIPYGLLQKRTDVIYSEGDSLWLAGNAADEFQQNQIVRYGVTVFDTFQQTFNYIEPRYTVGFDSDVIYDITGDRKNLYFAGRNGLTVYSRKDDRYYTLGTRSGLSDREATALAIGKDSLWIGTSEGLVLYSPSSDTTVSISPDILGDLFITDLELAGNALFVGTYKGTYYIDFVTHDVGRLVDPEGILSSEVRNLSTYEDELFVSTSWGLTSVNLENEKVAPRPYVNSPGGVYAAVANDKYIAAAEDDGLTLINRKSGRKRTFTEDDGLLSVKINAILIDGDYIWLGSDQGLTHFKWINPDRVD